MEVHRFQMAHSSRSIIQLPDLTEKRSGQSVNYWGKCLVITYSIVLLVFIFFLIRGFSYYTTPMDLRPHHSDYRLFRPAGTYGLRFGIFGTILMTLLLFYSLRKRTGFFQKRGRLKRWLDAHIFCGVVGPFFILLHTSFKLDGLVSISFWSMVAVALSGYFGRYLYQQIPRTIRGKAISIKELQAQDLQFNRFLEKSYGTGEASRLLWFRPKLKEHPTLFKMIWEDLCSPFRWARYRFFLNKKTVLNRQEAEKIYQNAHQKWMLERHIQRLEKIERIFHLWHVFHLPFATIMYAIMLIHIVIALLFGISWGGQA